MAEKFSGNFFDKLLDSLELDFRIPLGIAEITLHVSDPAKKWWKSGRSRRELRQALRRSEEKFLSKHPGNAVAQILHDFPLYEKEDFRQVVASLLSNLDEEEIGWFAEVRLEHDWGDRITKNEIHDALEDYLPYLRHELSRIPEFREVISALRIERVERALERIDRKTERMERLLSPAAVAKPIFYVPFPHNESFVGRIDDLERLHKCLQKAGTVGVHPAMLSGMGGIGKTQLAVEYAYQYTGDYPGGVYWIEAAHNWLEELAGLAEKVGLPGSEMAESQRTLSLARSFIDFLKANPGALLIFDNVEDPRSLLVPVGDWVAVNLPCHLLFTTRRRDADLPFESVEVRVLPEESALQLLLGSKRRQDLLGAPLDSLQVGEARSICLQLGYLPLALALAAAYLGKNPNIPLASYRKRLEKEGLKAVDANKVDPISLPTRHDASVSAILAIQWGSLDDERARLVLQAAALLGEAVLIPRPRLLLLTGLSNAAEEGYPAPLDEALQLLNELCLVEELDHQNIRLHPLVRTYIRDGIPDADQFTNACIQRLTDALWDIPRLNDELTGRGVDAVIGDIRCCLDLLADKSGEAKEKLTSLLEVLDREAHNLRKPFGISFQSYILQQIRDRALKLDLPISTQKINDYLDGMGLVWLAERTPAGRESPQLVRTFEGHTHWVESVGITPDGKCGISGSWDRTLRLWDLESGRTLRIFEGHTDYVTCVAITLNGKSAISGSWDKTMRLWDLESGQILRTFEGHTERVNCVAITSDGKRVLSGSGDNALRLWDLESGLTLRTFEGHTDKVACVMITSDGKRAISGSWDNTLRLWDLESGLTLRTFEGHTDKVACVMITSDGKRAISGSWDNTLRLWDLESGLTLRTFYGHTEQVNCVAIISDGKSAISGSWDRTLRLWDLESGKTLHIFDGHTDRVISVVITPDEKRALSGSWDNSLRLWDLESEQSLRTFEGHTASVLCVVIASEGKYALSGSRDKTLRLWDLESRQSLRTFEGHIWNVYGDAIHPDGKRAISGSGDKTLRLWDLGSGRTLRIFEGHTDQVTCVAIDPDGKRAISGSWDKTLRLWDLESGQTLRIFEGHTDQVTCVAIDPDGKSAISGSWDKTMRLWDLESGQTLRTFEGHTWFVASVAITSDGKRALSGSWDNTLRLWDLESGQILRTFEGHTEGVNCVAITSDGECAFSGSRDNTLRLWNLETGECLLVFAGTAGFNCLAVDRTSSQIVAGDDRGSVHFIEIRNWVKGN